MRTNTSMTLFDGAPINEVWEGWDFGRVPGLDALEELHVETNNSSAKFSPARHGPHEQQERYESVSRRLV